MERARFCCKKLILALALAFLISFVWGGGVWPYVVYTIQTHIGKVVCTFIQNDIIKAKVENLIYKTEYNRISLDLKRYKYFICENSHTVTQYK